MNYRKLIDSSLFELSFVEDPADEFLAFKTFNDDKLFQIIDVNFSITELVFGDKRLFALFAEKFMIRFLDPKEDVFFINLKYEEKTFFFKVSGMSGLANIVIAIAYAYDFLVRTNNIGYAVLKSNITQICTDTTDNVIVFLDDDYYGKEKDKTKTKECEVKLPIFFNNDKNKILN